MKLGDDRKREAYLKSIKIVRSSFENAIDRMKNTLELATLFQDTDKIEDRDRILRQADDVMTSFLKLENEYYRLELQLRFKVGYW